MEEKTIIDETLLNKSKEPDYKVYYYFKEHPTLLVSCISAMILSISFLFNALIYVNECKYLKYWNLDSSLVDVNTPNQIYEFVTLSFFYLVVLLLQRFIAVSIEKYQEETKLVAYGKIVLMGLKKELRLKKRQFNKEQKLAIRELENEKIEKVILELGKSIENFQLSIRKLKENMSAIGKTLRRKASRKIVATFIFSTLILTATLYLFGVMNGVSMNVASFLCVELLTIIFMWFLPNIGTFFGVEVLGKRKFKKNDINKMVETYLKLIQESADNSIQYPFEQLMNFELKKFFAKDKLISFAAYAFILLVCLIGAINAAEQSKMKEINSFAIVEYDNTCYAVIYKDDTYFYLEEATIGENEILIYVDKQRRIATEDICSENRIFETIKRIDSRGIIIEP